MQLCVDDNLRRFPTNSCRNFLRRSVHCGVPGKLNTFKGFYLKAFAPPIGTPCVSWPAVGTLTSLLSD